jgi:hypothetical protein
MEIVIVMSGVLLFFLGVHYIGGYLEKRQQKTSVGLNNIAAA